MKEIAKHLVRRDLVSISDNSLPAGGEVETLLTHDGKALRAAHWQPHVRSNGYSLTIFQGRTEFIERYAETIGEAIARGFHVTAFDWRGQGGSERLLANPRKGHIERFDDYLIDLEAVQAATSRRFRFLKPVALAHSMGGAVLLRALSAGQTFFERAVLSAPMIGLSMVRWPRLAHRSAKFLAGAGFSHSYVPGGSDEATFAFKDNPLTRDERRHGIAAKTFSIAPDLAIGSPTIGWTATSFDAMADLQQPEIPARIATPVLIVAGPKDRITDSAVAERFASRLPNGRFLAVADAEHEVLLEIEPVRTIFWRAFDGFMQRS